MHQEIEGLMLAYYAVYYLIDAGCRGRARLRRPVVHPRHAGGPPAPAESGPAGPAGSTEIHKERMVSSRRQRKPRGVKRKMSHFPLRRRGPLSCQRYDWTLAVLCPVLQSNSVASKEPEWVLSALQRRRLPAGHAGPRFCAVGRSVPPAASDWWLSDLPAPQTEKPAVPG